VLCTTPPKEGNFDRSTSPLTLALSPQKVERVLYAASTIGTVLVVYFWRGRSLSGGRTTPVLRTTPPREGNFNRSTSPLTLALSPQKVERVLYAALHRMQKRALSDSSVKRSGIHSVKTCQRFTCNLPRGFGMLAKNDGS